MLMMVIVMVRDLVVVIGLVIGVVKVTVVVTICCSFAVKKHKTVQTCTAQSAWCHQREVSLLPHIYISCEDEEA